VAGWQETLSLPAKAVLPIGLSLPADYGPPYKKAAEWYGVSGDTMRAGVEELEQHKFLERGWIQKKAPLSATGTTTEMRYCGRRSFIPASAVREHPDVLHVTSTGCTLPLASVGLVAALLSNAEAPLFQRVQQEKPDAQPQPSGDYRRPF
jgi:hypothetical protein